MPITASHGGPVSLTREVRLSIAAGAVLGALAVAAGAFAAHALRARLAPEALALVDTASRYQLMHALAVIAAGLLLAVRPSRAATLSAIAFTTGVIVFCGSLYALALGAPRSFGIVAPVGGTLLIAGWLMLAAAALQKDPERS